MHYSILLGVAGITIILDQISKWWVMQNIPTHHSVPVIQGFFDLVNIRNRGAAFGFLNRSDIEWQFWLFLGATCIATIAILILARSLKRPLFLTALGLILGGALGNLIDRIRFRAVVDFLDFYVSTWHWPAFNVADIAICIGAFVTCFIMYISESALKKSTHKKGKKI